MGYQSYQQPAMGMPMQQQQPFYPSPQYPSGYFRNQTRRQRTHQDTRDREAEVRRLVLGYSSNEENRDSGYYAENVMPKTARPDVLTLRVTEVGTKQRSNYAIFGQGGGGGNMTESGSDEKMADTASLPARTSHTTVVPTPPSPMPVVTPEPVMEEQPMLEEQPVMEEQPVVTEQQEEVPTEVVEATQAQGTEQSQAVVEEIFQMSCFKNNTKKKPAGLMSAGQF